MSSLVRHSNDFKHFGAFKCDASRIKNYIFFAIWQTIASDNSVT